MVEYQWNIFRVQLNPVIGSEQSGTRPVLVISEEEINRALPTVTVLPITSLKPGRKVYSIEAFLSTNNSGLSKDSIVMAHQVRCISKERLKDQCGSITSSELRENIRDAMRTYLDLNDR